MKKSMRKKYSITGFVILLLAMNIKGLAQEAVPKESAETQLQHLKDFSESILENFFVQESIVFIVYLNDVVSDQDLEIIHGNLSESFGPGNVDYISKEEAKRLAEVESGISMDVYEEDIFPASINVKIPHTPENQLKLKKWIDDFENQSGIALIKSTLEDRPWD